MGTFGGSICGICADADCLSPNFDDLNRPREKAELAVERNVSSQHEKRWIR